MRTVLLLSSLLLLVNAAPSIVRSSSILPRQNPAPFNGPVTVTTTSSIPTSIGTITQTCQVTLTPITVNGINAVREDKVCKNVLDPSGSNNSNNNNGNNNANTSTSTSTSSSTSTSTASSSEATSSAQSGSNNNNNNNNGGAGDVASPTDVSVIGTGIVSGTATTSSSSTTSAVANAGGGPIVIGQSSVSGAATVAGSAGTGTATAAADNNGSTTSAAEAQASSAAPFQIPGKKLQVLPIGLGVFAGISVIALIVVGLVTYERTKYRKTFRQRKLAESAAPMGYGGMAQVN